MYLPGHENQALCRFLSPKKIFCVTLLQNTFLNHWKNIGNEFILYTDIEEI